MRILLLLAALAVPATAGLMEDLESSPELKAARTCLLQGKQAPDKPRTVQGFTVFGDATLCVYGKGLVAAPERILKVTIPGSDLMVTANVPKAQAREYFRLDALKALGAAGGRAERPWATVFLDPQGVHELSERVDVNGGDFAVVRRALAFLSVRAQVRHNRFLEPLRELLRANAEQDRQDLGKVPAATMWLDARSASTGVIARYECPYEGKRVKGSLHRHDKPALTREEL